MNDTSPEVEKMIRERMMAKTGEERLIIGAQMFEAAREMVMASFPAGLSDHEVKQRLFRRFYGETAVSLLSHLT